jgi:hypothetical protein
MKVLVKLLDASLKPLDKSHNPKAVIRPLELEKYPEGDREAIMKKLQQVIILNPAKATEEGMFERQVLADPKLFPPGTWRIDVEIPNSNATLTRKITIRASDPEVTELTPDLKALQAMASDLSTVEVNISDVEKLKKLRQELGRTGDVPRLAFTLEDPATAAMIPDCLKERTVKQRNRGPIEDLWDKGVTLPKWMTSWYNDKPATVGLLLFLCVAFLSAEWLTRKLLRLA